LDFSVEGCEHGLINGARGKIQNSKHTHKNTNHITHERERKRRGFEQRSFATKERSFGVDLKTIVAALSD
jgi:hypothetical protein